MNHDMNALTNTDLLRSSVPMFKDLIPKRHDCIFGAYRFELSEIAKLVRAYDEEVAIDPSFSISSVPPKVLQIAGLVFHESRVGSTLVSNAFVMANPEKHRSFSESEPPAAALRGICGSSVGSHIKDFVHYNRTNLEHLCQRPGQAAMVLRDIMYLQSRSNDPREEKVLFKFQTGPNVFIPFFRKAFPDTPWIFLYRDPLQVLMSYLKSKHIQREWCVASRESPSRILKEWALQHGMHNISGLSNIEYCALVISSATQAGLESLLQDKSNMSRALNYNSLSPDTLEKLFENHFDIKLSSNDRERMKGAFSRYSKGKGKNKGRKWQGGDSYEKTRGANYDLKQLASTLLQDSYEQLSHLSFTGH